MASDDDQETNNKTSQEIWATSIPLRTYTGSRTPEQPNIVCVQWKLRGGNISPKEKAPRLWSRILRYHRNQKVIQSPRRQR